MKMIGHPIATSARKKNAGILDGKRNDGPLLAIKSNYRFFVLSFALHEEQEQLSRQISYALVEQGLADSSDIGKDLPSIARKNSRNIEELMQVIFTREQLFRVEQFDKAIQDAMLDEIFLCEIS